MNSPCRSPQPATLVRSGVLLPVTLGCALLCAFSLPTLGAESTSVTRAIPTGDTRTSAIELRKEIPLEVVVGKQYTYLIHVRNLTPDTLGNVVVYETFPPDQATLKASAPQAEFGKGEQAMWLLGDLPPKTTRTIRVAALAQADGTIGQCTDVTYDQTLCTQTKAVSPKLELTLRMPATVTVCDPISVRLRVRNTGTGPARNAVLTHKLPDGLTSKRGQNVAFRLDALPAGQSRELSFTAQAQRAGAYRTRATVTASGGLEAADTARVTVSQPMISLDMSGPETARIGKSVRYAVTLSNPGETAANRARVRFPVSPKLRFTNASHGGRVIDGVVVWHLDRLSAGKQRVFHADFKTAGAGAVTATARAEAECAARVDARARTTIRGIPAILLEVVDRNDPVGVGESERYTIKATNQGTATATNITIACTLENNMELVNAGGATTATTAENALRFAPLSRMAPGEHATWTVVVRALKRGDTRFAVEMTSDQLERPVTENEATQIY